MFNTILKKKLSDNQVANIFINALFDSVDSGWEEITTMINEDPAFVTSPEINSKNSGEFGLIVMTANISLLESTFEVEHATRIERLVFQKLAKIYGMGELEFENLIRSYQSFISRINQPSKNMVYGMSKAVFHKYSLNNFQDEYFKRMQAPNPLFLKRMDEVMGNFVWNWDAFFKKYRLS
jgi:hypothetical protein